MYFYTLINDVPRSSEWIDKCCELKHIQTLVLMTRDSGTALADLLSDYLKVNKHASLQHTHVHKTSEM